MFKALVKWIFLDKKGRDAAEKIEAAKSKKTKKPALKTATTSKAAGAPADGERAALMSLYRQRRQEYEQLDEDVQEKLAKLASDKLDGKDEDKP